MDAELPSSDDASVSDLSWLDMGDEDAEITEGPAVIVAPTTTAPDVNNTVQGNQSLEFLDDSQDEDLMFLDTFDDMFAAAGDSSIVGVIVNKQKSEHEDEEDISFLDVHEDDDHLVQASKAVIAVPSWLDGTLRDDVVELFSPPRMVPRCAAFGLRASLSVDIKVGWNLLDPVMQRLSPNHTIEAHRGPGIYIYIYIYMDIYIYIYRYLNIKIYNIFIQLIFQHNIYIYT